MYIEGGAATAFGLVALTVLRRFEDKDDHRFQRRVTVVLCDDATGLVAVNDVRTALHMRVADIEYEKRLDADKKRIVATFDVQGVDTVTVPQIIEAIESVRGVRRVLVQQG
jgi:putative Mg2+ transporter-C (MgtC) family protein